MTAAQKVEVGVAYMRAQGAGPDEIAVVQLALSEIFSIGEQVASIAESLRMLANASGAGSLSPLKGNA